ncbi:MAG TPA: ABC transporter ATP-binding protein [Anaerolineae bacterium]|nr:ABC transporter ATP-binding protein [Anaerolineae bacterium]
MDWSREWRRLKDRYHLVKLALAPYRGRLLVLLPLMFLRAGLEAFLAILLVPIFNLILDVPLDSGDEGGITAVILTLLTFLLGEDNLANKLVFFLLFLSFIMLVVSVGTNYWQYALQTSFQKEKRDMLFQKFLNVNWLYYLEMRAGDSLNNLTNEVGRARQWLVSMLRLFDTAVAVSFYVLASVYIAPGYLGALVAMFVVLALFVIPIFRAVSRYSRRIIGVNQQLMQHFNEFMGGFKVVKGSRMEPMAQHLIERETSLLATLGLQLGILKTLPSAILEPLILVVVVLMLYVMQSYDLGNVSELAITSLILLRAFQRLAGLQYQWISISEMLPSFALVATLPRQLDNHREAEATQPITHFERLLFKQATFAYTADKPSLQDIDLAIERGEFVGIVGRSGAGKTTLVDLILGLLTITEGDLLVNGKPLSDINRLQWRSMIGYVPQDTILFNDTIKNNITLLQTDIPEENFLWATQIAQVDAFVQELPQGYETVVGDRGAKLSGGQRQRLALARALVRRPQILLLDEATSALDSEIEYQIQMAIENLRGELTIIVVAHRLSTIMNTDKIVVLEQGEIVELGSPQALLANSTRFQEMYQYQGGGE